MTKIPPQRKRRRFVRDIEIHGHHKQCLCFDPEYQMNMPCTCVELDYDDWIAAGEREYDAWKEGDYLDKEVRDVQEDECW